MHDCGHGTMFKKRKTRDRVGIFFSLFSLTPYYDWRDDHAIHHQTSGNLDKRGNGDIWTMTVREYQKADRIEKFKYLFYRNPFITFFIGPLYVFGIRHRIPFFFGQGRSQVNLHLTTLFFVIYFAISASLLGFWSAVLVNYFIYAPALMLGTFLFYMQHQYEDSYWREGKNWDYTTSALQGSSYFKLPALLQWFTGNIGFHHIHHLNHKIPFYRLEECFNENPCFQNPVTLTISEAIKTIFIKFYDEDQQKMITMSQYRRRYHPSARLVKTA